MLAAGTLAAIAQTVTPALKQADTAFREGQAALAKQDLAQARSFFEQVVHLAPQVEQGHSALGSVLLSQNHPREAIHELETALALNRADTAAQTNLAYAYPQVGQPAKALPLFAALDAHSRATKHSLAEPVLVAYAQALAATGDPHLAASKLKQALQSDPNNANLHDNLGSLFAQQHNWQSAKVEFTEALRLQPDLASAHFHLGMTMQQTDQPDAFAEFERAAQLAPDNDAIALELGRSYASLGDDARAAVQFQKVLARDSNSIPAMLELALVDQRTGQITEATVLLRKVVEANPKDALALTNLGVALTQSQQAKDAVPVLQRAISLLPSSVIAHQDLAAAFVQLNQLDDAVRELQVAIKLEPSSAQAHYDLGLAFKLQDRPGDAIPEFEAASRLDAKSPEAPYALGLLYMQAGRYADAAPQLKRSLDLRPENGDAWATLGSVYNKLERLPEAIAALDEATRQLPDQPDPHLTLAAVLTKQNKPTEALAERKKAAELMRSNMNRQRAEVATNAAINLLSKGDLTGAADRFHDALNFDPNYREAHFGLAKLLDQQGKPLEAAEERRKAEAPLTTPP